MAGIRANLQHQKLEATHLPLLVAGIQLSKALIRKWINKIPPINSKALLKGPRNKAAALSHNSLEAALSHNSLEASLSHNSLEASLSHNSLEASPGRHRLEAHRVMAHPATVHLSNTDDHTVEDVIMAVVVAVVQATDHGTAVTAVVAVATTACHGATAACHGAAKRAKKAVAAGGTKMT
jgi:hypothetical protein